MNTSISTSTFDQCPGAWVITSLSVCIVVTGIIGNAVVVLFVRHDIKSRKTPDRVLLMHLSVINLIGCLISLPLQYLDVVHIGRISLSLSTSNAFCFTKLFSLFYCIFAGFATLVVLCFDRYEAITKFPQQRMLTYAGTIRAARLIFLTTFFITFPMFIFYIVDLKDGNTVCEGLYIRTGAIEDNLNLYGNISLIVVTAVIITLSNISCFTCLFLVDYRLRHHIEEVRSTLGNQTQIKEVRMVHSAFAFILTYSCIWIPFGAARGLRNVSPNSSVIYCFYVTTFTVSYSTFSVVPYLYMICDKRIGKLFAKFLRRRRVAPGVTAGSVNVGCSSTTSTNTNQQNKNTYATSYLRRKRVAPDVTAGSVNVGCSLTTNTNTNQQNKNTYATSYLRRKRVAPDVTAGSVNVGCSSTTNTNANQQNKNT